MSFLLLVFLHILRILSHTSLYHINNYRSIQTYIIHNSLYVLSHFIFYALWQHWFGSSIHLIHILLFIVQTRMLRINPSFLFTLWLHSIQTWILFLNLYNFFHTRFVHIDISFLFNSNILSTHSLTHLFHTYCVYITGHYSFTRRT